MGRVLETLRQAEMRRERPVEPLALTIASEDESTQAADAETEIPFIEVGGPRGGMEASAAVLASKPMGFKKDGPSGKPAENGHAPAPIPPLPKPTSEVVSGTILFRPAPAEILARGSTTQRFAADLITYSRPEHQISEEYRRLACHILEGLPAGQPHVLTGAASTSAASATVVLLNLAITLARRDEIRVAIVDAKLGQTTVAESLGLRKRPGLAEVLAGTESLDRAVQESGQQNLMALTAGEVSPGLSRRSLDEAIRPVLRQLRDRFDFVLVDGGPWDGSIRLSRLASASDGVYLILGEAESETAQVDEWMQAALQVGGRPKGCIVTRR